MDPARLSQDYTKSSADDDFWGAPSPDLTLSIHGLSPGLVASPSFSFQTGFEFEGVSDDHDPRPPPELPLSPEQTPMPPSAEFAAYTQDSPGFLSPGEERSSYLAESPSGTSGEDSFMDPVMVQEVAREARAARLRSTTLNGGSAPWTSTPPRPAVPSANPPAIDIFGRPLPSAPPMADPFSIIVEPTSPTPRKKSILGSGKSALASLAESARSGNSSQGYWDNYNITANSQLGASPPRPTAALRQSPLPTRSQTEPSLKDFMLHPTAPPAPSNVPRSSTFTPLTPPLVDLPSFPPRSHSPSFDERPRSRGAMSDIDDEPAWIATAAVIPPRSSPPRSHSQPIPQGGLGLAARRNLPSTLQQPLATARRGSALHHSTPQSAHHPPAHSHYPTIRGAPTPTPTSASLVAPSPTSTALPSPWSSAPSHTSSSTRALVHPPSSPPPNVPAPHPPPFVSLFISSGDSPAKSTARPTRDSVISPPRGSMRQRPVGAEVELEDLVKRAQKVEAKLMGEGESQSAKTSSRRKDYARSGSATAGHARSETQGSKWWRFGLEGGRSSPSGKRSSSAAEGWSTLGEGSELRLGGERTAEERRLERERRKVREARRKTQDWLSSTTEATSRRGRSWGGGWRNLIASRRLRWLVGAIVALVALAVVLGVVLPRRSNASSAVGTCACENGGSVKGTSGGN